MMLVVMHKKEPQHRNKYGNQPGSSGNNSPADAGQEQHEKPGRGHQDGGAQVGLHRNKQGGHKNNRQGDDRLFKRRRTGILIDKAGHHQRDGYLCYFRRLKADNAEIQPALGSFTDLPEAIHQQQ